jgi:hypothetical protein
MAGEQGGRAPASEKYRFSMAGQAESANPHGPCFDSGGGGATPPRPRRY